MRSPFLCFTVDICVFHQLCQNRFQICKIQFDNFNFTSQLLRFFFISIILFCCLQTQNKNTWVRGKFPGWIETPPTHNPPTLSVVKDTGNIFYCTQNQVSGLCAGGDMIILFFGLFHGKMAISPPTKFNNFPAFPPKFPSGNSVVIFDIFLSSWSRPRFNVCIKLPSSCCDLSSSR